jgi:adenylate cyclase
MSHSATDKPRPSGHPSGEEVSAELDRVLRSQCFEQAGRSQEFLRFVVEQALAGAADRLKGYTIAIEVFRRPADFDAQSDPLVRVEAGRLRRRLLEYYVAEGYENPVRIDLPRGGYMPEFRYHAASFAEPPTAEPLPPASTAAPAESSRPPRRPRRRRLRTVAAIATIVVLAGLLIVQRFSSSDSESSGPLALPSGPKILVLPFENLSGDPSLDYVADGVTEEIMLKLSGFNLFVIASQTTWSYRDASPRSEALPGDLDAPYVLTGSVRETPERIRISARLVDRGTSAQLWAAAYDEDLSVATLLAIQEKIASEVAATIAVPYGPIYEQELARAARKPPEHLDTYDCVLKYYSYRRVIDPELHRETVECFSSAVVREPMFADAWAGLALLYLDEYGYGYSPQDAASGPLERAREAARTALDIDGENYLANLALARVRFFSGDLEGFARSTDRVLALDPNNAEALVLIGTLLAVAGSSERALQLVEKALALSPRPPGLYYLAQAVTDLRAGRADDALSWALRMDAPNWYITPLIVAASAGLAQRDDVAARATTRLLELYPGFPERARTELAKWQLDPPLLETILRGLRAAGLEIA